MPVRARVEDAALERVEREERDAASRIERGLGGPPREAAVLGDLETRVASDRDDLPSAQDGDRHDAGLGPLLPPSHDAPGAGGVVRSDQEPPLTTPVRPAQTVPTRCGSGSREVTE